MAKESGQPGPKQQSFWASLPGMLTALATLVTAITGLVVAVSSIEAPRTTAKGGSSNSGSLEPRRGTSSSGGAGASSGSGHASEPSRALPDLYISEFELDPATPTQGTPVSVRVGVYNKGTTVRAPFEVQWWAGQNFTKPACTWRVDRLAARGGRILTCEYAGYRSWYRQITTKVLADSGSAIAEHVEGNNEFKKTIRVLAVEPRPSRTINGRSTR